MLYLRPQSALISFVTEKGIPSPEYLYDAIISAQPRSVIVLIVNSVAIDMISDDWIGMKVRTILTAESAEDAVTFMGGSGRY